MDECIGGGDPSNVFSTLQLSTNFLSLLDSKVQMIKDCLSACMQLFNVALKIKGV